MLTEPTSSATRTIVLIDPKADSTSSLAGRLQMQGYTVSVAEDPADGARMALADPPAAVIADLWMPSISGVQLCRLLKAEPATEHTPVILRGPDTPRNRFWAERAGASAYVVKGRMGDLVRALRQAIAAAPVSEGFFTTFAGEDIRERIAAHLDAALFESVLSSELRALGTCGAFDRLFDMFSQFVSRVATYRWLAVSTREPSRLGLHASASGRLNAEAEARAALHLDASAFVVSVEDNDACDAPLGPPPIIRAIELGGIHIGDLALSLPDGDAFQDEGFVAVIAREIAGPIRMATLVEESQRLATIDALTGLMNRRAASAVLQKDLARAARYGQSLSLILLDVDHFKMINDRLGHRTGDVVLAALGKTLLQQARLSDTAARWGGEEFVVALTCTDAAGGVTFSERLRAAIEAMVVLDSDNEPVHVTASIGVATYIPGDSLDSLVDRADRAMYAAKSSGRNRVVTAAGPDSAPGITASGTSISADRSSFSEPAKQPVARH
ncbi:MAG TPA: diguanylate cyclase [Polyangiaceae bacterium]|nr:diguanylate cyclase [Polyangiaceae bacterium]